MEEKKIYICPKCGNPQYEASEIRTTGSFLAKIFDVQNVKFTAVTCTRCRYTELYKADSNTLGNILDFFTN
ncbi:MAG: zinc ribbon domain-containing protein [Candidatus Marinimicrobia bacterium]|nr:zinc ribbon domain-containing protein [Candidatus Neomarinimicrobiota bacterium]